MESLKKKIENAIKDITKGLFDVELDIVLEEPKEESFGDYTTNFLFKLAKQLGKSPKGIGNEISLKLQEKFEKEIEAIEVAGGFLNIKISSTSLGEILDYIRKKPDEFGKNNYGQGKRVNLEFVSTNPTGP
ncbi:MAG TPA: arginine--tRNA ligase, partial [candidate division WOR-3 bacterium]|nr:arginine--tRNA ligase [candidate division WOR-3 bacterium]